MMNKNNMSFSQNLLWRLERTTKRMVDVFGLGNSSIHRFLVKTKAFLKKIIRPTELDSLDICVAEHCNLGCYSCNHFSQLAEPEFA
ncbi:MAG: hypothetical protein LBD07_00380, partial [Spirochaetaceae bacterium]|nr:hypothetical protein [Spirochaetaceae bacterium]